MKMKVPLLGADRLRARRRLMLLLLIAVVGAAAADFWLRQSRVAPTPPELSFTDLDTALARESHGWELHIRPPHPGPYRLLPGGSSVGSSEKDEMICRGRDRSGAVVEELRVRGMPGFDQRIVWLETPDGRQTMAVLKRPH